MTEVKNTAITAKVANKRAHLKITTRRVVVDFLTLLRMEYNSRTKSHKNTKKVDD